MHNDEITDPLFRQAVEYIDAGNTASLRQLLEANPQLVNTRLDLPGGGYFRDPYLLWFVADNPIRHEKLPANIPDITRLIIDYVKAHAAGSFQNQVDYTLGLVATGRIPRECGVQLELIDLLIDEGATPGNGHGAVAHGNIDAARRLIERGGTLTLATAVCLDDKAETLQLLQSASASEKQIALMAAAFYGKPGIIRLLIDAGADVNAYIDQSSGFHSHASPLHQAVFSGSLESVQILLDADADLAATDRIYNGTPFEWSQHMQTGEHDETRRKKIAEIEALLRQRLQ